MKSSNRLRSLLRQAAAIVFGLALLILAANEGAAQATNVLQSTGNAGIGTLTPTQPLEVVGNVVTSGSQTMTTASKGVIEVTNTLTNNASSISAFRARNLFNGNSTGAVGLDIVPTFAPNLNVPLARGGIIGGFFAPPSGVTIDNVFGLNSVTAYNDVSGAVINGQTFVASVPIVFGALKPTNQFGVHIFNQGISGTTNSYGLYVDTQSGSTNNYAAIFAGGNVGIGTTAPSAPLHIYKSNVGGLGGEIVLDNSASSLNDTVGITFADGGTAAGKRARLLVGIDSGTAQGNFQFLTGLDTLTEKVRIQASGNVGIGNAAPSYKLDVAGEIRSSSGGFRFPDSTVQTTAATMTGVTAGAGLTGGASSGTATVNIGQGTGITVAADAISVNYGSGAGTSVEGNKQIVVNTTDGISGGATLTLGSGGTLNLTNTNKGSDQFIFKNIANAAGATQFSAGSNTDALRFEGAGGTTVSFTGGSTKKVTIDSSGITSSQWTTNGASINYAPAGNVGIGVTGAPAEKLHVVGNGKITGNLTVDGTINAKYQDVAEWVPSSEQLSAGTVVVLDQSKSNQVISSTVSYDTRVAGVISEQPGITLGESGAGKVLVATTGRVRVKVDATRGPIQIGDLLVTSDVSGLAMKSEPIELGGRKMHMPGTLIGKALEPLAKGKGEILVLLSLQ